MSKRIATYNDLVEEKQQLEVLLKAQRELITYDVKLLKAEFQPAMRTFGMLGKFFSKDKSNTLITTGADTVIDLVFKKFILGRAGWVARLVVPYLMKNVSSHVIADNKNTILHKVISFFRHKKNGKIAPGPDPATARKNKGNGTV